MSRLTADEYNQVFAENTRLIYNLGLRLFRQSEEDAMDFTHDVYVKGFEKVSSFEGRSKFSTWLYSLALNHGLNVIRRSKKILLMDTPEAVQEDELSMNLEAEEMEEAVREALAELPEGYRLPLILAYYEKMPYDEMSQKLGIPQGTLKSNVHRGKAILRKTLEKRGIRI